MNDAREHKEPRPLPWLLLFMLAAFALRLWGIGRESLWWDEYTSHVYLDASSLREFLLLNRTLDPLTLPFYYTLEYLWTHYVHESVFALRLMSIFIGLATIPLLYALGRRIYGVQAGLIAAALLAVSPTHIHHSQSIRMYVVFIFLAAVVAWTFLLLLEKPRLSLWAAHGAASLLLYWTHPFAGLIPAVLGAFLLLRLLPAVPAPGHDRPRPFFVRWTALQCVLFAPTVAYLASVRFWPQDSTSDWIARPSLATLVADLFFDDISAFHWQFRLSELAANLGPFRLALDVLFAGVILALLLLVCLGLLDKTRSRPPRESSHTLWLLVWLLLPPLMLFAVSWTVRPCMFPRYTVHCMLALYLLLGGAVQQVRPRHLRALAGGALVGLLLLQWAWLQPGPQRTDWRGAGLFLHEEAAEGDIVLVESLLWRDVFTHNLKHLTPGPLPVPVAAAEKAPLLAAQAALCLGVLPRHAAADPATQVWAVIAMDYFEPGPPAAFEQSLQNWAIPFDRWFFPSIREIYVYRMTPPETPGPETMDALFERWQEIEPGAVGQDGELDHHAMQAFGDLATQLALHGRSAEALEILEGVFNESAYARQIYGNLQRAIAGNLDIAVKAETIKHLWDGYGFRDNRQDAYMRRAFAQAAALDPEHVIANFELGLELAAAGDYPGARQALLRAAEGDRAYRDMLGSLLGALGSGAQVPEKLEAVVTYRKALMALAETMPQVAEQLLRKALQHDPALSIAHLMLGYVLTTRDRYDQADEALGRYLATSDMPDVDAYAHMALIQAEHGRADLVAETLTRLFERSPNAHRVYGSLYDAARAGDRVQEAAASLRALWEGFDQRRKDREDAAQAAFAQAVTLDPRNTLANLELGLGLAETPDRAGAMDALARAGEQDPGYANMLAHLLSDLASGASTSNSLAAVRAYRKGLLAQSESQYELAVRHLEEAVEMDPRLDDAHTSRVFNLVILRRFEDALAGLQRYLDQTETPAAGAYGLLAVVHIARHNTAAALQAIRTAVALDADYGNQFGPLFFAVLEKRDYGEARAEMDALKAQGIDLYPLMHDLVEEYLRMAPKPDASTDPHAAEKAESRWRDAIAAFEEEDRNDAPMSGGVLFTGSSTARLWDLAKWFPDRAVLNRGFGGSQFSDVTLFAREIIGDHRPDVIVLYSGDNDIASGKPPETVADDGITAIQALRAHAPQSRVILLGIKLSASRWDHAPAMLRANALMEARVEALDGVIFADPGALLLDAEGTPVPEYYLADRLHLSEAGYAKWTEALNALL